MVQRLVTFAKVKCSKNDEERWPFLSWRCRNGPQSLMARLILCTWSWKLKLPVPHTTNSCSKCLGNPLRVSRLNQWFVGHEGDECDKDIQTHLENCMSISWLDWESSGHRWSFWLCSTVVVSLQDEMSSQTPRDSDYDLMDVSLCAACGAWRQLLCNTPWVVTPTFVSGEGIPVSLCWYMFFSIEHFQHFCS